MQIPSLYFCKSAQIKHCFFDIFIAKSVYYLGFISIRRYYDIDRGIGDIAIIATPRDQTISRTNTRLTCTLLNSSHRIHRP